MLLRLPQMGVSSGLLTSLTFRTAPPPRLEGEEAQPRLLSAAQRLAGGEEGGEGDSPPPPPRGQSMHGLHSPDTSLYLHACSRAAPHQGQACWQRCIALRPKRAQTQNRWRSCLEAVARAHLGKVSHSWARWCILAYCLQHSPKTCIKP